MVVFSSKHWRNLTNTVMGVQAITSDPLEKKRKELADYAGRVQALHQHIARLLALTDEITRVRQDILKDIQRIDASEEDDVTHIAGTSQGGQEPSDGYDRATATFVNHMSESNKMVRDARPQLEKAEMTAQDLVKRTNVLQERVRSRDQAYEELNHYNQKVADLKAEIAKKSKPNPKEDERLARNVEKHRVAQEQFTKIDTEVRGDMDIVIGQKTREISIVVAEYSRYIGAVTSEGAKDADTFSKEIPDMIEEEVKKNSSAPQVAEKDVDQYNMVVLTSRTWRNLSAKVFGVRIMVPDPLEKQRVAVVEHAAKAAALYRQLLRLSELTDEIRATHQEMCRQSRELIVPLKDEEASTLSSHTDSGVVFAVNGVEAMGCPQYTQALGVFADQLSRCQQSAQASRPQLQVAVGEAQKLVQRNADLQQKLKDRDRAFADLDHYNHKMEELKSDASKRSKKDSKAEERLSRVIGVKTISSDPLEKQRAALLDHAAKAQAFHQQLVKLVNLTDQMGASQLEIVEQCRDVLTPSESTPSSTQESGYAPAISIFADQLSRCQQSAQASRPQLQVAVGEAQKLVQRNADLQQKLKDRDRAFADLDHYNHKMEELKSDASKRSKKDSKAEERLSRNVEKHRMAQESFIKLDNQVRGEMSQLIEGKEADFAKIIAEYSRYLGVTASAGMQGITTFTEQVPAIIRQQVERDEDPFPFHNQNSGGSIINQSVSVIAPYDISMSDHKRNASSAPFMMI
ncbi:merozoite surface protein 3g, putative [Perkinsus marinus ATCC 50983]|uniref:Merozoite surface protein 3g, putative n=1 Tax=Perkinsus marinus (strain ATCC 50983 / TXsc) TaxID=423536 RepID=C5KHN8_PERM5|nr:merozoite surface protein 3g, putative [Perkinsus marinus ATCC 50983]EER16100.1 merozoite surface protein 3g, putative [Perkinsus marinus ATCC 50983]|eukprot:XP_002784304.1 merozoite surface protein 3g, putative [Perkinsus marinus ATCC 50983]